MSLKVIAKQCFFEAFKGIQSKRKMLTALKKESHVMPSIKKNFFIGSSLLIYPRKAYNCVSTVSSFSVNTKKIFKQLFPLTIGPTKRLRFWQVGKR